MSILVCGGAGYIGSHTVYELVKKKYDVIILDNLSTGHKFLINQDAEFYLGSISDREILYKIFSTRNIQAVINFAACSIVSESFTCPQKYYANNLLGSHNLLTAMLDHNIKYIIFSSSAAVYGNANQTPINEQDLIAPMNPYGETKHAVERMLFWYAQAYDFKYIALRYFNAAGANYKANLGELHEPETHLIPIILKSMLNHQSIKIFGDDYSTPDGTCVRDYIHVCDLANAHVLALDALLKNNSSAIYNLGTSFGYSIREILNACEKITSTKINYDVAPRRQGDPDILIACADKIKHELGWIPTYNLEDIIFSAWQFHKSTSSFKKLSDYN